MRDDSMMEFNRELASEFTCIARSYHAKLGVAVATFIANPYNIELQANCEVLATSAKDAKDFALDIEGYFEINKRYPDLLFIRGLGIIICGQTKEIVEEKALIIKNNDRGNSTQCECAVEDKKTALEIKNNVNDSKTICKCVADKNSVSDSKTISKYIADKNKRLEGKLTLITGAAQGFGRGLGLELAEQGAIIGVADLNYEGAIKTAEEINEKYGKFSAFPVKVDVGDEDSVKKMCETFAIEYGGIDIFISNAGVLKAGSLEDTDFKTIDFVTRINYIGYFLGAKYASKYMKISHGIDSERFFDIIQINSKSGLEGSNKNFCYAGSKFGGIGLTQSFALELVPFNIKVNSICPGNFLDGPLWCDPDRGLFVQYLKSGKVPGAKTIADVKAFYESKVPMKRGCSELDVARAVCYLVEQLYETGQALPVTGGQVMLN